jgi:hypothetical protein
VVQVTVVHDSQGNIEVLVVSPPDSTPVQIQAQPGQRMTEIEVPPDATLDLDSPQLKEQVDDLIENFQVEIPTSEKVGLTRKA